MLQVETPPLNPQYSVLQAKVTDLLLAALAQNIVDRIVTERLLHPVQILFHVLTTYQPGSIDEKTTLLKQLEAPTACKTATALLLELQAWERRRTRALELQCVIPDPAVLLKGS